MTVCDDGQRPGDDEWDDLLDAAEDFLDEAERSLADDPALARLPVLEHTAPRATPSKRQTERLAAILRRGEALEAVVMSRQRDLKAEMAATRQVDRAGRAYLSAFA